MSEKIVISPGVFTQENDLSYLPRGVGNIGAALIGPTVKGPIMIPTKVNSYSDYVKTFGETIESASGTYQFLTSHTAKEYLNHGNSLTVVRIASGSDYGPATASIDAMLGADEGSQSFEIYTLADGALMNNSGSSGSNDLLTLGTKDNVRWEISSLNTDTGTFALSIRRGNDTENRKVYLETWNNLSLDPNQSNYISKVIGDTYYTLNTGEDQPFIQTNGNYPNVSSYVRISDVSDTLNYLDENGNVSNDAASASLPQSGSGSVTDGSGSGAVNGAFSEGADGEVEHPRAFYGDINTQSQGIMIDGCDNYGYAIDLLGNQDEYDINMILAPGILQDVHGTTVNNIISMCENRGDCFYVVDPVIKDSTIATATGISSLDTSYAAAYWPWVQIVDTSNNQYRWVPSSVVMGGVIAFNDKVSYEWYAPAGLNRGGVESAVRAERKLTHNNRDTLYGKSVNPLATFPGQGVVAWGQKTLQKKASAFDRVNVRRLLIAAKKYIASMTRYLVFEQNTTATRQQFLSIANPYFESIQQNQGLYSFKVVMDETNNPADVVDRNILKGEIYLQPAKTAEFIIVDFNINSSGAAFSG